MAGLIPTGVGNTRSPFPGSASGRAHPHGRGEHDGRVPSDKSEEGSSPRAWGTRGALPLTDRRARLIPTGVGNTPRFHCRGHDHGAHPHGRGEHRILRIISMTGGGSSPRAWGTRRRTHAVFSPTGLIPTGVGNTSHRISARIATRAHPHGRGEHLFLMPLVVGTMGSSPRAWGTRKAVHHGNTTIGLIPTGVGNTNAVPGPKANPRAHPHGRGEHVGTMLTK